MMQHSVMHGAHSKVCNTLKPAYVDHGYKAFLHIRSILGWSQCISYVLHYNPLLRSARLYGQFSLDKTWTL